MAIDLNNLLTYINASVHIVLLVIMLLLFNLTINKFITVHLENKF